MSLHARRFWLLLGLFSAAVNSAAQTGAQKDVRYGAYDNDVLDFHPAQTQEPAPVLIHFHGGGWTGGDKKGLNPAPLLRAGIAVVSANYRFTTGTKDAPPYPAPMLDAAQVVQFVRSKAAE
ncbi:hypothetical protein [Prosthecobacter sp.]|uniref:hypothetical protein n=1 Tax=Prosthecobacter sp. TaxID=1965333 RepID=UPI0037847DA1